MTPFDALGLLVQFLQAIYQGVKMRKVQFLCLLDFLRVGQLNRVSFVFVLVDFFLNQLLDFLRLVLGLEKGANFKVFFNRQRQNVNIRKDE